MIIQIISIQIKCFIIKRGNKHGKTNKWLKGCVGGHHSVVKSFCQVKNPFNFYLCNATCCDRLFDISSTMDVTQKSLQNVFVTNTLIML